LRKGAQELVKIFFSFVNFKNTRAYHSLLSP
jgi:hypothetical protein